MDGEAYQGRSDGAVIRLTGEELTPYSAITDFTVDRSFDVTTETDGETLKKDILDKEDGKNLFLAIKITGTFKKCISESCQNKKNLIED